MDQWTVIEGPVIKIGGEFTLLVTLAKECSGLPSSSEFAECLKIVIPWKAAEVMRIEAGDLVCLRSSDGVFHMQPVKCNMA